MDSPHQLQALVLDPNVSTRVLLMAVLRRRNLLVTACDGEPDAAAHCLHAGRYAVVILSSDMPGFHTLLRTICVAAPAERPKVIVATTREKPRPAPQADVVLTKPFHIPELDAAVAKYARPH